jgi:uroporphyrinogen-III decarboxylase
MTELTPRERLLRLFRHEPVDRIPVAPFIHVNYVKEYYGTHDVDWVVETPAVYRHFGFDIIHRNCSQAPNVLGPDGPDWKVESRVEERGRNSFTTTVIHTPAGAMRYTEALNWTYEYDAEGALQEYPIKSEADFDLFVKYQPAYGPLDCSDIGRARAAVGDDGIVAPWQQGAFNLVAFYYRKLDDLLTDAVLNPDFYHRMMTYFVERYQAHSQRMIDAGADVISYAGNIANGKLVSPAFFQRYIWPYEQRFIEFIQSQGVHVLYHNCGYARNLIPSYPGLGMAAYESLTPPPYGDTILADAVKAFAGRTCLSGNIDQITLLREGTPAAIETAVQQTLATVRGKTPFILATTDYFNENTPHDNIHALADAGRKHGAL